MLYPVTREREQYRENTEVQFARFFMNTGYVAQTAAAPTKHHQGHKLEGTGDDYPTFGLKLYRLYFSPVSTEVLTHKPV